MHADVDADADADGYGHVDASAGEDVASVVAAARRLLPETVDSAADADAAAAARHVDAALAPAGPDDAPRSVRAVCVTAA